MKRLLIVFSLALCLAMMATVPSTVAQDTAPTAPPEATPEIAPDSPFTLNLATTIALSTRLDLETLATLTLGPQRPVGWSGNTNSNDPDLALSVRADLELLAASIPGVTRPETWFGVVPSSAYAIARDLRHDLELLADAANIVPRPVGWSGSEPILRCSRATQALVRLLESTTSFTPQADRTAPDFCRQVEREASTAAEFALDGDSFNNVQVGTTGEPIISASDAIGYLDLAGTARAGLIPVGERIELVARQSGDTAVLMLVRGVGFELFVDYTKTNVAQTTFLGLPNAGGIRVDPRCSASWCN